MINNGTVYGSQASANEVNIMEDAVYIRSNIKKLRSSSSRPAGIYQFEEIVYQKDEFIQMLIEENRKLRSIIEGK